MERDCLPDAAHGHLRNCCGGEADGNLLGVAAPAGLEAAPKQDHEKPSADSEHAGEKADLLSNQLRQAQYGQC